MGGRFSGDVRGGMEAVGLGGGGRSHGGPAAAQQQGGPNDAVDHFFQARGLRGLYTPVEVSEARGRPFDGHGSVLRWLGVVGGGSRVVAVLDLGGIGVLLLCLVGLPRFEPVRRDRKLESGFSAEM